MICECEMCTPKPKTPSSDGCYFCNGIDIPKFDGAIIPACEKHVHDNPLINPPKPKECGCPSNVIACCHDPKCPHPAHALEKPKGPHCGSIFCESATPPLPAEVEKAIEKAADQIWYGPLISHAGLSPILRAVAHLARKER